MSGAGAGAVDRVARDGRGGGVSRRRVVACAAAAGLALAGGAARPKPSGGDPRTIAWPASLPLVDGRTFEAPIGRGRSGIVVFWATWCGYCERHNARLEQLHRALPAGGPLVVGVAIDGTAAEVARFLRQRGWTFPVALDPGRLRAQFTARRVVPTTALVDATGALRELIPGELTQEDVMGLPRGLAS